jgi:hypothetical protein
MAASADDLLHLLYEDGDKDKPLSPMIINPLYGNPGEPELIGRKLGKNSFIEISEWASMVFLKANKKKVNKVGGNKTSRTFICSDPNCPVNLKVGMSVFCNSFIYHLCVTFFFFE